MIPVCARISQTADVTKIENSSCPVATYLASAIHDGPTQMLIGPNLRLGHDESHELEFSVLWMLLGIFDSAIGMAGEVGVCDMHIGLGDEVKCLGHGEDDNWTKIHLSV